jgi:hypothetical protein
VNINMMGARRNLDKRGPVSHGTEGTEMEQIFARLLQPLRAGEGTTCRSVACPSFTTIPNPEGSSGVMGATTRSLVVAS